jgi:UDP-N-acetylglucosamine 1-carboxyvinyltransferase
MTSFKVHGGKHLRGEITPQGAKNEALQVICAALLTSEQVTIHNIPDILDVNNLIDLVESLGAEVLRMSRNSCSFRAKNINIEYLLTDDFKKRSTSLRGSLMIMGPLLTRFGKGYIPRPGGDKIGRRRMDTHINGLIKLGAGFDYEYHKEFYKLHAHKLVGCKMLLEEASVTGTANIIMAAVLAKGETTIYHAACEPYVQQLCHMLNRMGAKISGIGSNLIKIAGVESLRGCEHTLLPDMIEVGSFIGLAAMTRSEITVKNVSWENLGMIPSVFRRLGIVFEQINDDIHIPVNEHYQVDTFIDGSILTIDDAPWPGFTPDLISVVLVVATQARGNVLIHQKMFESRLFFVDKLIEMGAQVILCDPHRASVYGLDNHIRLRPTTMTSPDIRAGVALLIAAMSANGTSIIHNIDQIDRGYQQIDERLNALGAHIERIP